jgi:hypothetical protein
MQVLFKYEFGKGPFIIDSRGYQRVLALIKNDFDAYVVFYDTINESTYIERVKNKFEPSFQSSNLCAITSEEEYANILSFCVANEIINTI